MINKDELAKQKMGKRFARTFPREELKVRKKDGSSLTVKGKFTDSSNSILRVDDADKVIEFGDVFERVLPNGLVEEYFAEKVNYVSGTFFPDHYKIDVASRSESESSTKGATSTTNNFYGNAKNVQIQQNTQNSTQSMGAEATVDFGKALEVFNQILVNIKSFNLSVEEEKKLEDLLIESKSFAERKMNGKFIEKALLSIKDIMNQATGNLMASGVLHLIAQMGV